MKVLQNFFSQKGFLTALLNKIAVRNMGLSYPLMPRQKHQLLASLNYQNLRYGIEDKKLESIVQQS